MWKHIEGGIKRPPITCLTIWDLFADDTYLLTNLDKVEATSTYHEWLLDSLAGVTANRQLEGDDASFVTIAAPTRVGNYQQIVRKTFMVSGTLEAVNKAGRRTEAARNLMKQMRELKNDMEYALIRNQASSAGGSATARSSAGMESWIVSSDRTGGTGTKATTTASASTVGFSSGTVASPVDGSTTAALTEGSVKTALQNAWTNGGDVTVILVDPTQKNVIDTFAGIATRFINVNPGAQAQIIGAASVYVTSYGRHAVHLHRHVRSSVVLAIDPNYWAVSFLRRPFKERLAKTGDGEKHMILAEFGLVSRNAAASTKIVAAA